MKYLGAIVLFLSCAMPVCAAAPTNVALTYNIQAGTLHVSARHPTDRQNRYYVRSVIIYKNGERFEEATFTRQDSPAVFEADVQVEAVPGDTLRVELLATEGGIGRAELTIPAQAQGGT